MSDFIDYLHEVFEPFGRIRARRMFGGWGIYHHDARSERMFALVADEVLYLKADEQTRHEFEALGMEQFEYVKNEKPMRMSYYMAPEEIYDDPDAASHWATLAWEAARRAGKKSGGKRKGRKKS